MTTPASDPAALAPTGQTLPPLPLPAPTPAHLATLATRAAQRALALLAGTTDPQDARLELLQLLQQHPDSSDHRDIAQRAGISTAALNRLRTAYQIGGAEGVTNAQHHHQPAPGSLETAADTIRATTNLRTHEPVLRDNTITYPSAAVQIRLGRDNRWYPYTRTSTDWVAAPAPTADPAAAYSRGVAAAERRHNQ